MDVIGFLCVSLGSRHACPCSEADFSSQNGKLCLRSVQLKSRGLLCIFCRQNDAMQRIFIKKICQESGNKLRSNAVHVQIFCQDLLANSITDPNGVCGLMDCSVMVFVDEFSNFFNIICRFAGAWSP
jgi:hypothetical protein